jgi:PAS domain S-box-containing protein
LKSLARLHGEIEERETKIRRLVDSNIIGIFIWDFEGRILEANYEFLRMVSYDREDSVSGRIRWADLTPPDWRDRNNARKGRHPTSRHCPARVRITMVRQSHRPLVSSRAKWYFFIGQGQIFRVHDGSSGPSHNEPVAPKCNYPESVLPILSPAAKAIDRLAPALWPLRAREVAGSP